MDWHALGFKDYPFRTEPISQNTLDLFIGHSQQIKACKNLLKTKDINIVIEGARGVGTTSFANYLRFSSQKEKLYFTPSDEIGIQPDWSLETLLCSIIAAIVRELEISYSNKISKNKKFLEVKALTKRISEAYSTFGINVGIFSYGRTGKTTQQPSIISTTVLGHYLKDLSQLVIKLGFKNGILIQLNNLDINTIHTEEHLKYLFNALRDFLQINNVSWLFVGDLGIRSFIARKVDRLDDIISYSFLLDPLPKALFHELIKARLKYYAKSEKAKSPLSKESFSYLYDVTQGRLRYIFGLIRNLTVKLPVSVLLQEISLDFVKPAITELARERIRQHNLSEYEETILKHIALAKETTVTELADQTKKNRSYLSTVLTSFLKKRLVVVSSQGTKRIYSPSLDAKIAYLEA